MMVTNRGESANTRPEQVCGDVRIWGMPDSNHWRILGGQLGRQSFSVPDYPIRFPFGFLDQEIALETPSSSIESSELMAAIQRSRDILELPDNWDDEGASRISEATWERATRFLLDNALKLWDIQSSRVDAPTISPVSDGSIDIHWKNDRRQLLINVPANKEKLVEFYGDDRGATVVKGTVRPSESILWLFMWLAK